MPEPSENVLLWAMVAYRDFLARAEETIGFGIVPEVDEIVLPLGRRAPVSGTTGG
jgi:hypothetical protein